MTVVNRLCWGEWPMTTTEVRDWCVFRLISEWLHERSSGGRGRVRGHFWPHEGLRVGREERQGREWIWIRSTIDVGGSSLTLQLKCLYLIEHTKGECTLERTREHVGEWKGECRSCGWGMRMNAEEECILESTRESM